MCQIIFGFHPRSFDILRYLGGDQAANIDKLAEEEMMINSLLPPPASQGSGSSVEAVHPFARQKGNEEPSLTISNLNCLRNEMVRNSKLTFR
jgi:hypothetical protein